MRYLRADWRPGFIFDSLRHLNCHSNFIPKIAPLERLRSGEGGDLPALGAHRREKKGAAMRNMDMASGGAEPANAEDCFGLGMVYSSGAGVAVDFVQTHKWFNIAAM